MDEAATRDRLQELRDEIFGCFTSSTSTEIRHAMLIVAGPRLSSKELEERWKRFTKSRFFLPPLCDGFVPPRCQVELC